MHWRNIDLDAGPIAVASAEHAKGAVQIKQTKSGHTQTLALSMGTITQLRVRHAAQAAKLPLLGTALTDENPVVAQYDGRPLKCRGLTH